MSKVNIGLMKLKARLDEDLKIDELHMVEKMQSLPHISSKWLYTFMTLSARHEQSERDLKAVYKKLYASAKNDSNYRVDTQQMTKHIEGDEEYLKVLEVRDYYKILAKFAENAYKKINDLSFTIQNIVEYKKFMSGITR